MKDKDFLILIDAWSMLNNGRSEINRVERIAHREKQGVHSFLVYYLRGLTIMKLHYDMERILRDCDLLIKEGILEKTRIWGCLAKKYINDQNESGLSVLLISRDLPEGVPDRFAVLADRVGEYINKDQEGKPIHGVLLLHSETGTEGGYWAFQDKRFITPAKPGEGHDQWSYQGLHILEDGDKLTIYSDEKKSSILWEGVIQLKSLGLFNESAFGWWIHSDQKEIDRKTWAKWFFEERPAQLIKINPLLGMSSE